jgi:hypothetical protein
MPAVPITPEEQSEVLTLKLLTSKVQARGTFCTEFGEVVATLNGICARIFAANAPDPQPFDRAEWA